jgi:hypothetical protein
VGRFVAFGLSAAVLALAGCGSDTSVDGEQPAASSTSVSAAAALSVGEAVARGRGGPLLVRGYLIERDGVLRLCDAILESYPPQCGEPSLRVEGPSPAASERRVSLRGEVEDGSILVTGMGD